MNIHKVTGLVILVLMILRFLWLLYTPKPPLFQTKPWEIFAERTVHWLIYICLIAMPLSGWIGSSSAGRPPHIGDFQIGLPIANDKPLISTAFELHEELAWIIIGLLAIHVAAAFFHYFVRKDKVLQRMLPFGKI